MKKRPSGWPRNICKAGLDRCFSFPYTILNMSARKVLWIILGATVLLWGGVFLYLLKPAPRVNPASLPPATASLVSKVTPVSAPFSENDYIIIRKKPGLSAYLAYLIYEGVLKSKTDAEWSVDVQGEALLFKVNPETKFLKASLEIDSKKVPVGNRIRVTVGVIAGRGLNQEIEKGDLKNQKAVAVEVL